MTDVVGVPESLLHAARRAWAALASEPDAFEDGSVRVLLRERSWLSPPGWMGVVALGDAAVVTVPNASVGERVRASIAGAAPDALPNLDWWAVGAAEVVGPAALFFGAPEDRGADDDVDGLPLDDPGVRHLVRAVSGDDASEAGIDHVTSPVFVVRSHARVVAASAYTQWTDSVAHMSVLTDPQFRRQGYARRASRAALAHAVSEGLLPQWRARPLASQSLAESLGLERLGAQTCARFEPDW